MALNGIQFQDLVKTFEKVNKCDTLKDAKAYVEFLEGLAFFVTQARNIDYQELFTHKEYKKPGSKGFSPKGWDFVLDYLYETGKMTMAKNYAGDVLKFSTLVNCQKWNTDMSRSRMDRRKVCCGIIFGWLNKLYVAFYGAMAEVPFTSLFDPASRVAESMQYAKERGVMLDYLFNENTLTLPHKILFDGNNKKLFLHANLDELDHTKDVVASKVKDASQLLDQEALENPTPTLEYAGFENMDELETAARVAKSQYNVACEALKVVQKDCRKLEKKVDVAKKIRDGAEEAKLRLQHNRFVVSELHSVWQTMTARGDKINYIDIVQNVIYLTKVSYGLEREKNKATAQEGQAQSLSQKHKPGPASKTGKDKFELGQPGSAISEPIAGPSRANGLPNPISQISSTITSEKEPEVDEESPTKNVGNGSGRVVDTVNEGDISSDESVDHNDSGIDKDQAKDEAEAEDGGQNSTQDSADDEDDEDRNFINDDEEQSQDDEQHSEDDEDDSHDEDEDDEEDDSDEDSTVGMENDVLSNPATESEGEGEELGSQDDPTSASSSEEEFTPEPKAIKVVNKSLKRKAKPAASKKRPVTSADELSPKKVAKNTSKSRPSKEVQKSSKSIAVKDANKNGNLVEVATKESSKKSSRQVEKPQSIPHQRNITPCGNFPPLSPAEGTKASLPTLQKDTPENSNSDAVVDDSLTKSAQAVTQQRPVTPGWNIRPVKAKQSSRSILNDESPTEMSVKSITQPKVKETFGSTGEDSVTPSLDFPPVKVPKKSSKKNISGSQEKPLSPGTDSQTAKSKKNVSESASSHTPTKEKSLASNSRKRQQLSVADMPTAKTMKGLEPQAQQKRPKGRKPKINPVSSALANLKKPNPADLKKSNPSTDATTNPAADKSVVTPNIAAAGESPLDAAVESILPEEISKRSRRLELEDF